MALYKVTPGDPIKIGSVDYRITGEGADDPKFPEEFPMKVGDVLLHSDYEKAKEKVLSVAAQGGYIQYDLADHRVLIDPVAYTAHIYLHLETGPRFYIGEVTFKQDLLADDYLRRFVRIKPGSVYDPDKLLGLQSKLLGMEYFEKVEIVPQLDEAGDDHTVPIEIIATPEKANKYRVGVGYATDVGPRFSMDYRRRYFGPYGHKLRADLSISQAIQQVSAEYRIPAGNPVRDYYFIRPEYNVYDTDSSQGTLAKVEAAYSVVVSKGLQAHHRHRLPLRGLQPSRPPTRASPVSWSPTSVGPRPVPMIPSTPRTAIASRRPSREPSRGWYPTPRISGGWSRANTSRPLAATTASSPAAISGLSGRTTCSTCRPAAASTPVATTVSAAGVSTPWVPTSR